MTISSDDPAPRPRILLVDDDYFLAQDMARELNELGCEIVGFAANLDQAMEISARIDADAVVLDINLHGQMIYPAIEILRKREIRMVFVSGYDQAVVPREFRDIPHLGKPAMSSAILAAMRD